MHPTQRRSLQKSGSIPVSLFLMVVFLMTILGVSCSTKQGTLLLLPEPRPILVQVDFLPFLVKGSRPQFPPARILVLEPQDNRQPYPIKTGDPLPPTKGNAAVLGI